MVFKMNSVQANALSKVTARNYIVGSIGTNGEFSISSNPVEHHSLSDANAECLRLARLSPGKAFIAMHLVGGSMLPAVVDVVKL